MGKGISAAGEKGPREVEALGVGAKGGNNELTQNELDIMGGTEAGHTFCPKDCVGILASDCCLLHDLSLAASYSETLFS